MRRKVFILLMKFPNFWPRAVGVLSRFYYNHASIGLEEDVNTFYSFVYKGFIVEKISRYIRPDRKPFPCRLYEIEVSEKAYQSIKAILNDFVENKDLLQYSKAGVILCLFHIPFQRKHHYFCSQFVAKVLELSKAVSLQKNSALYLPRDVADLQEMNVIFQGNLYEMALNKI